MTARRTRTPGHQYHAVPGLDELRERLLTSGQWYVEQLAALVPAQAKEIIRSLPMAAAAA